MAAAVQSLPPVAPWVEKLSDRYPLRFKRPLLYVWRKAFDAEQKVSKHPGSHLTAAQKAVLEIHHRAEALRIGSLSLVDSDQDIISWAKKQADAMVRIDAMTRRQQEVDSCPERRFILMAQAVAKQGIEPPMPTAEIDEAGCIARMTCAKWWRGKARKAQMRRVETAARDLGLVRKQTGCYVSEEVQKRVMERNAHNASLLESLNAVSNHGDEISMATIAEQSLANPKNRFAETIVRVKGLEALAEKHGDRCDFVTLTAPSRFHAYMNKTGHLNPSWVEAGRPDVREANDWLQTIWQRVRAQLKRVGLPTYWFRVSEAHHDGCPHWHLMVWTPSPFAQQWLRAIFESYALEEELQKPDCPKAQSLLKNKDRRIMFKSMESEEGGAAGYCVKYLAKHLSADKLNNDLLDQRAEEYGQDPLEVMNRVQAWASCWGIRQFQFNGAGIMGLWREFRRLGDTPIAHTQLERLRRAADESDFAEFVELLGGRYAVRGDYPVRLRYAEAAAGGLYGDMQRQVVGIETTEGLFQVTTRIKQWEIQTDAERKTERKAKSDAERKAERKAKTERSCSGVGRSSVENADAFNRSQGGAENGKVLDFRPKAMALETERAGESAGAVEMVPGWYSSRYLLSDRPRSEAAAGGEAATPWTCVNNCTEAKNEPAVQNAPVCARTTKKQPDKPPEIARGAPNTAGIHRSRA